MTNAELAAIQAKVDEITAQAQAQTDVETAAEGLIGQLGQVIIDNKNDPAAIEAIGVGLTNAKGRLSTSADALAAAIVAGTPAQP